MRSFLQRCRRRHCHLHNPALWHQVRSPSHLHSLTHTCIHIFFLCPPHLPLSPGFPGACALSTYFTLETFVTHSSVLNYSVRSEAFRTAGAKFRILHWRLHFDDTKDEMGGDFMDVRSWESFQQDMLDVVKDLKYFPPPDQVAKWTLQGKLGKQGMKDNDDMSLRLCVSVAVPLSLSVCLSVSLCLCLSLSLCLSVSLSVCLLA